MPWVQRVVPRVREGLPLPPLRLHHHVEDTTRITRVVGVRIVVVEEVVVVADDRIVTKRRLILTRTEGVADIEVDTPTTTTITDRVRNR
jgi:hypothetical protein